MFDDFAVPQTSASKTAVKTSVAMCTYDGERFLQDQLVSISSQSRLPDEMVVCDDNSSDETWSILCSFSKSAPFPVRLIRNERNLGVVENFEKALRLTSGDVVFLSDQDDVWRIDKIERISEHFETNPATGMVITDAEMVDENLSPQEHSLWHFWRMSERDHRDY